MPEGDNNPGPSAAFQPNDAAGEEVTFLPQPEGPQPTDGNQTPKEGGPKNLFDDGLAAVKENRVFSACVVVDIVLILVIFAVTLAWLNFAQTEIVDFDPALEMYCMKCEYVQASAADIRKYFPNADSGKCCAEKESYMKDRLKKVLIIKLKLVLRKI